MRNHEKSNDLTIWIARYQTNGRGQRGNSWESVEGLNLTFSILLKPDNLLSVNQFVLSQLTALSIVSYLSLKGITAKIKWPNDIYVEDRKICGILLENILAGDKLSASIVGIGLNLNQVKFNSDAPNPTSLLCEMIRNNPSAYDPFELEKELSTLLKEYCLYYSSINTDEGVEMIKKTYHERLYRLGESGNYIDLRDNSVFQGKILGVDNNARLELELPDGQIKSFAFKELKYIL